MSYYDSDYLWSIRNRTEYSSHYRLCNDLINDPKYRASPNSYHHSSYKKACNRWFLFFLAVLVVGFYPVFPDAAHGIIFVAVFVVLVLIGVFLFSKGMAAMSDFLDWLSGN